ncbi:hypothetical protein [Cyclobacterium plantarum]|uniref:hypothetical protein n=1 Tax=Cyclobacterium plantarum TaxID=2716263 RepID=UPI003F6E9643
MKIELELTETLRYFLLPISIDKENKCVQSILDELRKTDLTEDSYSAFLKNKYNDWKQTGMVDPLFRNVVINILKTSNPVYGEVFAEKYFDIHSGLSSNPFISFNLRSITLSHLRLICSLAVEEKMSSAKIARILAAIDTRLDVVSWREVQTILRKLKSLPEINQNQAKKLFEIDILLEEKYFADSDLKDASFQIGEVAKSLQFAYNAEELLNRLTDPSISHLPYLQILHYQCLISEFYDHVLSIPYEFSPRGNVANWLFSKWNNLLPTSNPILNNAKAVDILDKNWARSKSRTEFENASVLVDLLQGIDGMGFAASQELASWIRRFLIRYIRQHTVSITPIPEDLNYEQIKNICTKICSKPTASFGILEQRLTDVLSASIHSSSFWRSRGLGDSVNANNLARKKLGDVDFQNNDAFTIKSYEAHGGTLNKIYFEAHLRTFHRAFDSRVEELETVSDIDNWSISIIFLAYDFENGLNASFVDSGKEIEIEYKTFKEVLDTIDLSSYLFKDHFLKYFIKPINDRRTPAVIRQKVLEML